MKDLYSLLHVPTNANDSEIKKSYRKLAFQCHPDKNKSSEAATQFREISEAYDILRDEKKRKMYDQFGYDTIKESNAIPINPLDLFQSLFNVDFGRAMDTNVFFFSDLSPFGALHEVPQHSLVYTLELTLEELYSGTQKEFTIQSKDQHGIFKETKYVLNIKAGTKHKEHLVVSGGGHYNPLRKTNDDLVVSIKELEHSLYKRQEDNLVRDHTISLCDALCGSMISMDHFGDTLDIKIDTIVKPNSLYQVFGQGMPIKQGSTPALSEGTEDTKDRGDLILDLKIEFPEHLSDKRKGYLKQILGVTLKDKGPDKDPDPDNAKASTSLQAYYYKDKEEVMKEFLDDEEESSGCLQQ